MRARPLTLLTATATVLLVVVAACEAKVQAKVSAALAHSASDRTSPQLQPTLADLLLQVITPPRMSLPGVGLGGLQERVQRATDEAAGAGATLSIAILDRATHQLISNGNPQIPGTASVAKLFIADEVLLQESQGKTTLSPEDHQALDTMLRSSDDDAAEKFWDQDGGDAIITDVATRYGLTSTTPPSDGRWWNTISSPNDLIRYYDKLLDGSGGLPRERARLIFSDLAQSTPTGIDGYPQRFGIPDGLFAEPVAVKQGWMCCIGSDWMHLSTGVIGPDRRFIMVIESLQPTDDATARHTITQAVKTMFPTGRI
jgi:hypothetical protein